MYPHPVYLPTKTYFYATGNTPAVDLLEHLPPEEDGRALVLGCGDPRSILHTVYTRVANSEQRRLDVTCCDIEPGVIARNVLLLSLIIESADFTQLWAIFYHVYLDPDSLALLVSQCRKLADASKDLDTWKSSPYSQFLKLCTADTCTELNQFWQKYLDIGSRNAKEQASMKARFAKEMKQQRKFDTFDTTLRTAGIWFVELMPLGLKHFKQFWDTGLTTIGSPESATHVNPTYAFTSSGEQCSIHHASDPILGFHLAPVLAPLLGRTNNPSSADAITLGDIDQCALKEFQGWCEAYKRAKGHVVVRFFVGEALSFCYALQAKNRGLHLQTAPFISPWTNCRIALNPYDYNVVGQAPARFNIIDTSNLADHLGLLNVLPATIPLLEASPSSSLVTDTLLPAGTSSRGSLEHRLCGDIGIMALLLGAAPIAFSTGFSTTSKVNEHFFNSASSADVQLPRETFVWKLCPTAFGETPCKPFFDPSQLAQFLYGVFLKMFVSEGTAHLREMGNPDARLDQLVSEMTLKHYTRRSFVLLLRAIRDRVVVDWDMLLNRLMDRIEGDRTLTLGTNFFQDLYIWMHASGVYTFATMIANQVAAPPKDQNAGRFKGWKDIPGMVCVLLVVPRQRLKVLLDIPPEEIGTPALQVDLKLPYAHNMFGSYQILFGKCRTVRNESAPGEDLVDIEEDKLGLKGTSDAIVSVWMPTWILRQEVHNIKIGLSIHPSPAASGKLMPKLGVYLSIFETKLMDKEHVHVLRDRPGFESERSLLSGLPAPVQAFVDAKASDVRQIHAELSSGCEQISLLKSRIDVVEPDAKKALLGGAEVSVVQSSCSALAVKIGAFNFDVDFELPVDGTTAKLRVARKSSFVEVLVSPVQSDCPERRFFNPAPILTPSSCSPVLRHIHYLDLDTLPALDTSLGPSRLYLLRAHMAGAFSERERASRDTKPQEQREVISNVKDTIASMLLVASNLQDIKAKVFALDMPPQVGIYTLIFVEEVRVDLVSNTVVADAYILPLTEELLSDIHDELTQITTGGHTVRVATHAEEVVAWKRLLPAFVERCRKWPHSEQCQYKQAGNIPLSTEPGKVPICSCGAGKDLGKFAERTPWKRLSPYVTRAAISPLFAASFLEDIGSPLGADVDEGDNSKCAGCGGPGKPKLLRCARCKKVSYCTSACQKAAWKKHKVNCRAI